MRAWYTLLMKYKFVVYRHVFCIIQSIYGDLSRIFPTFACNEKNYRKNGNNEGFAMNDDLLKRAGGGNFLDGLLSRIHDIRSSSIYKAQNDTVRNKNDTETFSKRTMKTTKILFFHGFFASGSCIPAQALKQAFEGKAEVLTPDLPLHPRDALDFVTSLCEREHPDVLVGNSNGSFLAQIVASRLSLQRKIISWHAYKRPVTSVEKTLERAGGDRKQGIGLVFYSAGMEIHRLYLYLQADKHYPKIKRHEQDSKELRTCVAPGGTPQDTDCCPRPRADGQRTGLLGRSFPDADGRALPALCLHDADSGQLHQRPV